MHHIQRTIIDQLMFAKIKRFSELRPSFVESNLFQYHLRHVIKEGYVEKVDGGYTLSPTGLYYADRHSSSLKTVREQPKIITVLALRNSGGQVLLEKRHKQPFIGTYNLPAGKLHTDESVDDAAHRELYEKTSLDDIPLRHVSTAHTRIVKDDQLISEYIAFIYTGTTEQSPEGARWYDSDQVGVLKPAPSVAELIQTLDQPDVSLHEIDIRLS